MNLFSSLKNFAARKTHLDDIDESLVGELTDLEKLLLKSQELMTVRGKVHFSSNSFLSNNSTYLL